MDAITAAALDLAYRWLRLKNGVQASVARADEQLYDCLNALFVALEQADPDWYMQRAEAEGAERMPGTEDGAPAEGLPFRDRMWSTAVAARWRAGMAAAAARGNPLYTPSRRTEQPPKS